MQGHYLNRALSSTRCGDASINVGTVSKWCAERRFGFIRPDNGPADVYAHIDQVVGGPFVQLHVRQRVTFTIGTSDRTGKPEAQAIRLAN
jgi:cold shock protein